MSSLEQWLRLLRGHTSGMSRNMKVKLSAIPRRCTSAILPSRAPAIFSKILHQNERAMYVNINSRSKFAHDRIHSSFFVYSLIKINYRKLFITIYTVYEQSTRFT